MKLHEILILEEPLHDVDHMPGKTVSFNKVKTKTCSTCNGYKHIYSSATKNKWINPGKGAKRIACPDCGG